MAGRLRRQVVNRLSEPTLRRIQRLRNGENPSLKRPVGRTGAHGVTPAVVAEFDAHVVRAEVARVVSGALDAAAVPYVLLPGPRGTVRQVAVSVEDRAAALSALAAALTGPGWAVEPGPAARAKARVVKVHRVLAAPSGHLLCGLDTTCEIAFWTRVTRSDLARPDGDPHTPGTRLAPTGNQVVGYLTEATWARATVSSTHWPVAEPRPDIFEVREPVDIVYTWVDGADPAWQARKAVFTPDDDGTHNASATRLARFLNRDELKYSLRSIAMFAGWARRIYLVTGGQLPDWLDPDHPRIVLVDHREIFTDPSALPVFNSHAIESQLHHIPDLAQRYLYLNDDVFLGRPVEPELFFHGNGIAKLFVSRLSLDLDPAAARDLPAMSAAKNQRALIERDFGLTVRRKFKHGVHPQLRSVLVQMEQDYPDIFQRVAESRFRHPDDMSIAASLHHYYAYVHARAVPAGLQYRYQDISRPDTARRLDEFLRQRPQVFCLNDMDSEKHHVADQQLALRQFFAEYFPVPAPWERR